MGRSKIFLSVGLVLAVITLSGCGQAPAQPVDDSGTEEIGKLGKPPQESGVASVLVEPQNVEKGTVTVEEADALENGWLVIHADNQGKPGMVIGYAPVVVGENDNLVVMIDQTKVTSMLYAMLHVDAGTAGVYEFPGVDAPIKDGEDIVMTPFSSMSEMMEGSPEDGN